MPAMLRRTSASCRAGSVSRRARSANAIACSLLPAMCNAIAVVPTISPRCGWWAGAISSARCPNCAAVPGSVVTSAFAASSSVAIATSSPTSALAASCTATSTGRAPASSRTTAAWRSSARRAVTGTLARTASRVMSCQNASFSSRSTSRFASSSSPTGASRSEAGRPSVRASSSKVNVRPSEAATVTASLASSESRPSRSRIFSCTRRGSSAVDQLGAAVDDADPLLFLQSEERLDDEERAAVGFRQLLQDRLIGLRGEHVRRQLRDRIVIERAEGDRARSLLLQLFERVHERRRFARRAKRDHPGDRQSHQSHRQRAKRRDRSAVRPVGVVDRDQERRLERRALEQLLQVAQQPEPLLGLRMKRRELAGIEQRLGSVEQRREQRRKLDHRLARIGCAAADSDAEAASDRRDLGEQAALAHAGGALDDDHRFGAVGEAFELASNQREFRVASVELPRWDSSTSAPRGEHIPGASTRFQIAGSCDAQRRAGRPHSRLPQLDEGSGDR